MPLCSFASKNVTNDNGILHGLLKRLAERTDSPIPEALTEFQVKRRAHWESYFRLSKAEGLNKRRAFEFMLKTDGYAVSVISKVKMVVAAGAPVPAPDLHGKRVIGLDPGRTDLVSCAWSTEDGEAQFSRYSNKVC